MSWNFTKLSLVLIILTSFACSKPEMPVLGELPAFELIDQNKQTLRLEDLKGKVWVANFIFTSCAGTCPVLTQRMTQVQDRLTELKQTNPALPARIVSFSVDPERDTPEKLAEYARRYRADANIWSFLTGPGKQVEATVVQGFKMAMGKVPLATKGDSAADDFDVIHGERFVLVDAQGRIRGYYQSDDGRELRKLMNDLKTLLKKVEG